MCVKSGDFLALSSSRSSRMMRRLRVMLSGVMSPSRDVYLEAMMSLKFFLTDRDNHPPPIDYITAYGIVPRLVRHFGSRDPAVKLEAVLLLTLLTMSEDNDLLVENGVIQLMIELLSSPFEYYRALGVNALKNVVVKSPRHRGYCLDCGAMRHLLANFTENSMPQVVADTATLLHHFFLYSHPAVDEPQTHAAAIPVLGSFLLDCYPCYVITSASAALSILTGEMNPQTIQRLVSDSRIVPRLISLLEHASSQIRRSALRIIYHIVKTDFRHSHVLIDNGFLPVVLRLLTADTEEDNVVKTQVSMILFRVTMFDGGCVIESGLMNHVIDNLIRSDNLDTKLYALWVVSLVASERDVDLTRYLVATEGCIDVLCELLTCQQDEIVLTALQIIADMLIVGQEELHAGAQDPFHYKTMFVTAGGLQNIRFLVTSHIHGDNIIRMASRILEEFW